MRRAKKQHRTTPFLTGVIGGYCVSLLIAIVGALIVLLTDNAETLSGTMAMISLAAGSFAAGRISGALRRKNGLKTGALCALLYISPLLLLSVIFGVLTGTLLLVKLPLCIAFGATGGVFGVNASDT